MKKKLNKVTGILLVLLLCLPVLLVTVYAADVSGTITVDGISLSVEITCGNSNDKGSCSVSGSGFYAQATGTKTLVFASTKTTTVTLTNKESYPVLVRFSSATQAGSSNGAVSNPPISPLELAASGEDGASITIKVSDKGETTTSYTFTVENITKNEKYNITLGESANCPYTATLSDGTVLSSTDATPVSPTDTVTLKPTPAEGYTCVGFADGNGNWLTGVNTQGTATFSPAVDCAIVPILVQTASLPDTAPFQVGSSYYYLWDSAFSAASGSPVILAVTSYTLPTELTTYSEPANLVRTYTKASESGIEYIVPSGGKFLVPFDAAYTATFSGMALTSTSASTVSMYSCLTLEDGVTINCYGSINVNATQFANSLNTTGHIAGSYGAIHLDSGAQINMKSGSNLYAFGYIGGGGMVWAESGSNVYQLFQIRDWRGGNASLDLKGTLENNSFLFSQYYVQNIEAKLRIDCGAGLYASFVANISEKIQQRLITLFHSNEGLFLLTDGYLTMEYDPSTDYMSMEIYGDVSTSSIAVSFTVKILVDIVVDVDSSDYIMPLPMNYIINVKSGSTLNFVKRFKLLPGTQINIESGATAIVSSDAAMYLYDADDWNSGNYTYSGKIFQLPYVYARKGGPVSRSVNSDAVLQIDGMLTANGPLYSTKHVNAGGNAGITGSGTITIGAYGSTNLLEVSGASTDTVTITCVPAVGLIAGHERQNSFALGTYKSYNSNWYQYTITGENITCTSGGIQNDTVIYTGSTKDTAAAVEFTSTKECVSITSDNATLSGSYTVSDITPAKNEEIETVTISATDHSYTSEVTTPATCTTAGVRTYTCQNDNSHTYTETIVASGHSGEWTVTIAATCTTAGLKERVCTICSEVETEVIRASKHNYVETVNPATCTAPAHTYYRCSCGEHYAEIVAESTPLGHDFVAGTCTRCGAKTANITFKVLHNLNLLDRIKIGYWISTETTDEALDLTNATYGIEIWSDGMTTTPTLTKRGEYWQGYGEGIYAQRLDTPHYACPYVVIDGEKYYSETVDAYSVPMYAQDLFGDGSSYDETDVVHVVVRDLLNYATDVQRYFLERNNIDTGTISPINNVLITELQKSRYTASMKVDSTTPDVDADSQLTCTWGKTTINLEDAISMNFHAVVSSNVQMPYWDDVSYAAANGAYDISTATHTTSVYSSNIISGGFAGKITEIYAKDIEDWYYARMYDGTNYSTVKIDSVAAYLTRGINESEKTDDTGTVDMTVLSNQYMISAFKNMLAYGESALNYAKSIDANATMEGE